MTRLGTGWTLNHVGMVVTDRNATLSYFQQQGVGVSVGPQPLLPHEAGTGALTYYQTLKGDPVTRTYATGGAHNFRDGECQIGNCQLEVYPMRPGPGMFISEYLAAKGPGINHVCFNTPTIEEDTARLLDRACPLTFNATVNGRTVENYLDTRLCGDLMISLRPPATAFEALWKQNNEAHPLVPAWRFLGLGIGVDSAEASADYFESLGFAARAVARQTPDLGVLSSAVSVGPLRLEFHQSLTADSVVQASLSRRGEGVSELAFAVADLDAETARLEALGTPCIARSRTADVRYFDTRAQGNILLRLEAEGDAAAT
ncbi:MAG: VOC family protein [Pseudomonadota bacterium]|nr:VOC family protein [Pseudomonadota bacterium]